VKKQLTSSADVGALDRIVHQRPRYTFTELSKAELNCRSSLGEKQLTVSNLTLNSRFPRSPPICPAAPDHPASYQGIIRLIFRPKKKGVAPFPIRCDVSLVQPAVDNTNSSVTPMRGSTLRRTPIDGGGAAQQSEGSRLS